MPDLELICENMLMAEGFLDARPLAKKFITLYMLNKDLLRLILCLGAAYSFFFLCC